MQGEEWLELRVGRNNNIPCKKKVIFSCNFCRRKFCSSQALGGHQNAHRRERSLLGHVYGQSHNNMIMPRSLSKPASVFGAEGGSGTGQLGMQAFVGPALVWHGSGRSVPDTDSSNSDILDLNLKL